MSFIISADTSYVLQSESEHFITNLAHIHYYLDYNEINVDKISDNKPTNINLIQILQKDFDKWYNTKAKEIHKSVIFYKYAKSLHSWISEVIYELSESLVNSKLIDLRKSLLNQEFMKEPSYRKYIIGITNAFDTLYKLSNIKHTFKEALEYESNRHKIKMNEILIGNFDCNQYEEVRPEIDCNIENEIIEYNVAKNTAKTPKESEKKKRKKIKRILNKSIKCLESFIGYNNVKSFINGDTFEIEGKYFNYKVYKKNQYKLLNDKLSSVHIPYNLDLYNKDGEYLSNMCITFNGCPILDQILSLYLMIQSDQEHVLFENSNHYNKSDIFKENIAKHKKINDIVFVDNILSTESFSNYVVKLNKQRINKIKSYFMKRLVKDQLIPELYSFIFDSVESWDEIIDLFCIDSTAYETSLDFIINLNYEKDKNGWIQLH